MSRFRGFLLAALSRLLESGTRNVVIGDLTELNLGSLRSAWEMCGLIARQQASLWKDWPPWLVLLGIVGLVGIRLNFIAGSLTYAPWRNLSTYLKYGARYESGLTTSEEFIVWLSLAIAVMLWSWSAGFALISLSRKTGPFIITLLCIVWLCWNGFRFGRILFVLPRPWVFILLMLIPSVFFFLPAVWGARRAYRGGLSSHQAIILLAATVGLIALVTWTSGWPQAALERWSEGVMHGGAPWYRRLVPYLLLSWPTAWVVASSSRHGPVSLLRSKLWRLER